jgi:arabinan endo-1,5-alpha-L-arabinosidase
MASRAAAVGAFLAGSLPLLLGGCHASPDTVAASAGDYDPTNPPTMFPIAGTVALTDPAALRWNDTYWVFSSGPGIAVHSSKDLLTFAPQSRVFAQNPAWIGQTLPEVTDLWAPDVHSWNGTIHLYYAASTFSSNRACIGHATATSLALPSVDRFVDQGFVICSNTGTTTDDYTAIDPSVVMETPDQPWLVFGSWGSGIKLIALDRQGNRRDTTVYSVAARPSDTPALQAPYLYRRGGYDYLFVSFDNSPNHTLRVGRATQVQGPYLDRDGKALLAGGGTLVLTGDSHYKGPGSNSIFDDEHQRLNLFHAYGSDGTAVLRIAPLVFDNDGWPVTAGP